ncbi:hypothetical protein CSV76_07990 [Sporosarcina sp. P17b]|nr:hypothetical protein CSV76_07990 [Sporosarcina sp. P17b]
MGRPVFCLEMKIVRLAFILGRGFPFRADAFLRAWLEPPRPLRYLWGLKTHAIPAGVAARNENPGNVRNMYVLLLIKVMIVNTSKHDRPLN